MMIIDGKKEAEILRQEIKKEIETLLLTILEALTIQLIRDYIKSLGCYTSKTNPIQGTRDAIFK